MLLRVKGKTYGLSIQKTDVWVIPETDDATPRAEVASVDEEIGRGEAPNVPLASPEAAAAPRPEGEASNVQRGEKPVTLQHPGRARDSWNNHSAKEDARVAATLKTCETG